ncbi:CHAT domain-containing protein [Mycena capillaripes]|nr:CHAT domain-containing protein [Mycena capillaripes]
MSREVTNNFALRGEEFLLAFQANHDIANLNAAVEQWRQAKLSCPQDEELYDAHISNLATALQHRFHLCSEPGDLDEAITLHREALCVRAPPHQDRRTSLSNLSYALRARFRLHGELNDLDEAIPLYRELLELQLESNPAREVTFDSLGTALLIRFDQRGDPGDLDEAIMSFKAVLALSKPLHPRRNHALNNLVYVLIGRFERDGKPNDLDDAIALQREVLALSRSTDPLYSSYLCNLGSALQTRFQLGGDSVDLDDAIAFYRDALSLLKATPGAPALRGLLNNLATALETRFLKRGEPDDSEEAINLHRAALAMCPAPHPERVRSLTNLAISLETRFKLLKDMVDLDAAITFHQEARALLTTTHPDRWGWVNNLANALQLRFIYGHERADLDDAVKLYREALQLRPPPHPDRGDCLNNLAAALRARFEQRHEQGDLNEAVTLCREALVLLAPPHPNRRNALNNLAETLQHGDAVIDESIDLYKQATAYDSSSMLDRLDSASRWVRAGTKHHHVSLLDAFKAGITLLPQVVAVSLNLKSRRQMLTRDEVAFFVRRSAAGALALGEKERALEWSEATRSVFWTQALQLRIPLDELAENSPALATELREIAGQLEAASFRAAPRETAGDDQGRLKALEAQGLQFTQLNRKWNDTLAAVRNIPDFQDFLLPKKVDTLCEAAHAGLVVILLADDSSASALIVTTAGVRSVQLSGFDLALAKEYAEKIPTLARAREINEEALADTQTSTGKSSLESPETVNHRKWVQDDTEPVSFNELLESVLQTLWHDVVYPIIDTLKLSKSDKLPRLWWCPTGIFSFLPIHAAGIYDAQSASCVSDYVVSSYTPTLTSLLTKPSKTPRPFKMTAVIHPEGLPGTQEELKIIERRVPGQWLTSLERPYPSEVMPHLQASALLHFACHGVQDAVEPLNSGLLLTAQPPNAFTGEGVKISGRRLKVTDIMKGLGTNQTQHNSERPMSLAFLGACQTAKGDQSMPDEAMHLAASLLFAGFHGVVGTMWSMADRDGPSIADTFYTHLFKDCVADPAAPVYPDLTKAAEALHIAVKELRENGAPLARWVPFVHYGL